MNVYAAINAVQKELATTGITKDRTAQAGKGTYKFRGIDDVFNALCPLLAKHGLCILPRMLTRSVVERESNSGNALFYVVVEAEFDFVAIDGSKHTVKTFGEAMDSGDKATNKAMSAAYKYAAFQAFAIPTEGDNDSENQTHEVRTEKNKNGTSKLPEGHAWSAADAVLQHHHIDQGLIGRAVENIRKAIANDRTLGILEEWDALDNEHKVAAWKVLTSAEKKAVNAAKDEVKSKGVPA